MALGGGNFISQNKVLPGTYINFVSAAHASAALSDRGYAAMPPVLGWGIENEVFAVTSGDFQKNSLEIFGYPYTHEKMKGLRDLFANASMLYAYRLDSGGEKALCQLWACCILHTQGLKIRKQKKQRTFWTGYWDFHHMPV